MSLSSLMKLTYFPIPGRAWVTRTCFKIAKVEFIDDLISFQDFGASKTDSSIYPLFQVPVRKHAHIRVSPFKITCFNIRF